MLLGDRYGWQGFPPNIPCEEFDILLQESQWQGLETHILTDWFLRDDNAVPPEYILQVRMRVSRMVVPPGGGVTHWCHVKFDSYGDATSGSIPNFWA